MYLIGYGSLMNKDEFVGKDYKLVNVLGWKRIFNKVAARGIWREKIKGNKKATLNVVRDEKCKFNAIAMLVTEEQFMSIVDREKGYVSKKVTCVEVDSGSEIEGVIFVVDSGNVKNIFPVDDYLEVCRKGAYSFGSEFGKEFDRSTYLSDGKTTIEEYVAMP